MPGPGKPGRPKGLGKTPGSGRKKGTPNRATQSVKDAMQQAFDEAGGVKFLGKLAKEDPRTFATLLAKLIPNEVKADVTGEAFRLNINLGKDGK